MPLNEEGKSEAEALGDLNALETLFGSPNSEDFAKETIIEVMKNANHLSDDTLRKIGGLARKFNLDLREVIDQVQGLDCSEEDDDFEKLKEREERMLSALPEEETETKPEPAKEPERETAPKPAKVLLDDVLVPPDAVDVKMGDGSEKREVSVFPREALVMESLEQIGVNIATCTIITGEISKNMMRKHSYNAVVVPELDRTILVCDEAENKTFVIFTAQNAEKYSLMRKSQLDRDGNVIGLNWCDPNDWQNQLKSLLLSKRDFIEDQPLNEGKLSREQWREYYNNPANVRTDLENYTKALGPDKTPMDLTVATDNMQALEITLTNGQKVKGYTYIRRAAVAYGIAESQAKDKSVKWASATLTRLLKIAGYPVRDKDYYSNQAIVRHDIDEFAKQLAPGLTPMDISSSNFGPIQIKCFSGETVKGMGWLQRAAVALDMNTGVREKSGNPIYISKDVIIKLLEIAGYVPRDKKYYQNSAYVSQDLQRVIDTLLADGVNRQNLYAQFIENGSMRCSNGEEVRAMRYLSNAAVLLGIAKDSREAYGQVTRTTLDKLIETAGIEIN